MLCCGASNTMRDFRECEGVPHVVAIAASTQLADVAARIFTHDFYLALAVGKTVREAFEIGQKAVRAAPIVCAESEAQNFILLPQDGQHDRYIFEDAKPRDDWYYFLLLFSPLLPRVVFFDLITHLQLRFLALD